MFWHRLLSEPKLEFWFRFATNKNKISNCKTESKPGFQTTVPGLRQSSGLTAIGISIEKKINYAFLNTKPDTAVSELQFRNHGE